MTQVYYAKGDPWDHHNDIQLHRKNAKDSDQPFAAVIKDLKSRGLFKDTLVVCGSEFGRTPVVEVGGGTRSSRRRNGAAVVSQSPGEYRPSRREVLRPIEYVAGAAIAAIFTSLIVLMVTRDWTLTLITAGGVFIIVLVTMALFAMAVKPDASGLDGPDDAPPPSQH